jgi:RND family efflux transporter MFP subunit
MTFNTRFTLLLLLAGTLAGCSSQPKTAQAAPEAVSGVAVVSAQRAQVPNWLEAMGTVRAAQSAQVAAQMMGNVVAMNVREGDRVRRGQVLAVIDDAQPRAGVERAQAMLLAADKDAVAADADFTLAQATLKRYQNLLDKKSVSPQEFDEVKARFQAAQARRELARAGQQQAQAALSQARTQLDYTRVRAPFDGVITDKRVDAGAMAAPGMPLLTVEDTRRYRLEATVDESQIQFVKQCESVPVTLDAFGDRQLTGKVTQVVPAADPASRSFLVKIDLPTTADIRSGLFGRARFQRGQRESLVVPASAVVTRGQLQGVYVLGQDKVAMLRYVTLGKSEAGRIEVLSGLQSGEQLVANPGERELAGKMIR